MDTSWKTYLSKNLLCTAKIKEGGAVEVVDALFDGLVDDFDVILHRNSSKYSAQLSASYEAKTKE